MTARAEQFVPLIRAKVDSELPLLIVYSLDTMSLESQGLPYYAFYEHESRPLSIQAFHIQKELQDLVHALNLYQHICTHIFM
jgi:hypothetical protein